MVNKLRAAGESVLSVEECEALAKRVGAVGYLECSSLTQKNLKLVFDTAIRCGLTRRLDKEREAAAGKRWRCNIL